MGLKIALVGATGAVGAEFLNILDRWDHQIDDLKLLASRRSQGTEIEFRGKTLTVEVTTNTSFVGSDIVFISANTEVSRKFAPVAVHDGAIVIDDGSAFRLDPEVPLVVPEINGDDLAWHKGIISTPNCTTVPLVMVLHTLQRAAAIRRVIVSTYQSVSGAGAAAVQELRIQTEAWLGRKHVNAEIFPHQIAFNVIPAVDDFLSDGYSKEEWKMQEESRKILGLPDLRFSATCVRVPVVRAHSMAINVEFEQCVEVETARNLLAEMPGILVVDDPKENQYPHPLAAAGEDAVLVGRIRKDTSVPDGLAIWLAADNLRKGSALNAVQILEALVNRGLLCTN